MTKYLFLYHSVHYGKNNLLNDIYEKNSLCYCAVYGSNIIMIMMTGIVPLTNISFVNRRFIATVNDYQHEHGVPG